LIIIGVLGITEQIEVITERYSDNSGFGRLREDWEGLLRQNRTTGIFQTMEWNEAWWESFGAGRELVLLAVKEGGGSTIGIAPLYRKEEEGGGRLLRLIGGVDLSDYLDLIYLQGHEGEVCTALLQNLLEDYQGWDTLELHNIPGGSPTLIQLQKAAQEMGLKTTLEEEEVCPYIPLPSTWEDYLSALSKKDRHELRRKMRKAGSAGGDERYVVEDHNDLSGEVEEFFELHCKSKMDKCEFMEENMKTFFKNFTALFHRRGWLDLSFLMINGQRAASLLSLKYRGRIYVYNSGYDPAFSSYSAGIALIGQSIRAAIEGGYRKYDFLRGNEGYKYRLGAHDAPVYQLNISYPQ
jgi:CelD/BcsL family acetyltransferase involved in cellulose biosynthesis